LLRSTC